MNYLTIFLLGVILGLILNLLVLVFRKRKGESLGEFLATKEDIKKITKEIEEIKLLQKENIYDPANIEEEFYDENRIE